MTTIVTCPRRPLARSPVLGLAAVLLTSACEAPEPPQSSGPPPLITATLRFGYPPLDAGCVDPTPATPNHLLVTTTDFNTGAVSLIDLATHEVHADLALASTDAVPVVDDGRVFVINRFGFDYVDELAPSGAGEALALRHQFAIEAATTEAPANPQALALDPSGRAWLSLLGAGELHRIEFPTLTAAQPRASAAVDLREFADGDGIPELSAIIPCGGLVFVAAERVDRGAWVPADQPLLIPVAVDEPGAPALFDWDPERPGADAVHLAGQGFGRWRRDPSDPSGRTIVALTGGLERVDLAAGTRAWLVEPSVFEAGGYDRLQLADFGWDASGRLWVSAATDGFASFELVHVELADGQPPGLTVAVTGLQSVTGALALVGERAYFADTTIGASGVRVFDLAGAEPSELPESPLAVGLPPMSLAPL